MKLEGGMDIDPDSRVRTVFGHNPSTLRLCSFNPNLQNIPRGSNELARYVKDIFVAPSGSTFVERDFSAIEAVLVGYFAGSAKYIRFAKLGVHDYLNSHLVGKPADLSMSDADLKAYFKDLKKAHPIERDAAKRVVHGSNYLMSSNRMFELYPEFFPTRKDAAKLQSLYFDLFPEIRKWHRELCDRVDGTKKRTDDGQSEVDPWTLGVCYLQNPFGYVHRFYSVLEWEKIDGKWYSQFGDDAKRVVAFLPQSTAAAIIKQAAKRLFYETEIGEYLRLLIHDSVMFECPLDKVEQVLTVSSAIMEAPILELPLDPTWNLGDYLNIMTESKVGQSWGDM